MYSVYNVSGVEICLYIWQIVNYLLTEFRYLISSQIILYDSIKEYFNCLKFLSTILTNGMDPIISTSQLWEIICWKLGCKTAGKNFTFILKKNLIVTTILINATFNTQRFH
jgi:hypothetical protein